MSVSELHLFTYLGCLLSLYKQRPVSEWGYEYVGTKLGAPFGPAIDEAVSELETAGLVSMKSQYLQLTAFGHEEYTLLQSLSVNARRETYLEGACSSVLALPIGMVREAMMQEPELHRSRRTPISRKLLEQGPGLDLLYEHFSVLSHAIGIEIDDLMVPSVLWLTYLAKAALANDM